MSLHSICSTQWFNAILYSAVVNSKMTISFATDEILHSIVAAFFLRYGVTQFKTRKVLRLFGNNLCLSPILTPSASCTRSLHQVSAELARLACDAACQMTTCSTLPPSVAPVVAGRACNFAHTLLVEAVRPAPASGELVTAALGMLRAMTALSDRLGDEDRPWWSNVLGERTGGGGVGEREETGGEKSCACHSG